MALPDPDRPLVLVPTALELDVVRELGGLPEARVRLELCGFGPLAAAARTSQLLAQARPRQVLLIGIAGSLDLQHAPLEGLCAPDEVWLDGVGAGRGADFLSPSELGFPQWRDARGAIEERLALAGGLPVGLVTVCAASASAAEAAVLRARHPRAVAEDMEGFGAALACALHGLSLSILRGISNPAGERDRAAWRVRGALAAARLAALEWIERAEGRP